MTPKNPDKSREEAGQLSALCERDTGGGECTLSAPPGVDFDKSQTLDGGPINENACSGRVVVDLFCGMGGFSEGARLAGVETVLAVDAWGPALAVHVENHPSSRHVCLMLGEGADGSVEAVAKLILESVGRHPLQASNRHGEIGNAVCPPVAQALIEGWLKTKETLGGWL